jgi:hypothetical protein
VFSPSTPNGHPVILSDVFVQFSRFCLLVFLIPSIKVI